MAMAAGKLDRRIRIERATAVDDGYQTRPGAWAELATVWAQFIPMSGKEAREQLGREATMPASFRIRWSSRTADVSPADRVRYPAGEAGRIYEIKAVNEIGRREGLELVTLASDRPTGG